MRSAHRAAWEIANGPVPEGLVVRHKCDNRPCINLDHLELGTSKDNAMDRVTRGRSNTARGVRQHLAKLTDDEVQEIRQLYSTGNFSQRALAARYGVQQKAIWGVVNLKTWTHV